MKVFLLSATIAVLLCMYCKPVESGFMCGVGVSCAGITRSVSLSDGCNRCSCSVSKDGRVFGPMCTKKLCRGGSGDKKTYCRRVHEKNRKAVEAAKKLGPFMCGVGVSCAGITRSVSLSDGCNRCSCSVSKDGRVFGPMCTKKLCRGGSGDKETYCRRVHEKNRKAVEAAKKPGPFNCGVGVSCAGIKRSVSLSDGCNGCWCGVGKDGRVSGPVCTLRYCHGGSGDKETYCRRVHEKNRKAVEAAKKLGPFSCGVGVSCAGILRRVSLSDGCNGCSCSVGKDGRVFGPMCTRRFCPRGYGDKKTYCRRVHEKNRKAVEAAKKLGPFMCGVGVSCEGITHRVSLSDGCNRCWCSVNEDGRVFGPMCTRKLCRGGYGDKETYCRRVHEKNRKAVEAAYDHYEYDDYHVSHHGGWHGWYGW